MPSGLKGRAMTAQGEALGPRSVRISLALKGRANRCRQPIGPPLQGYKKQMCEPTQDCALGFHSSAFQALRLDVFTHIERMPVGRILNAN